MTPSSDDLRGTRQIAWRDVIAGIVVIGSSLLFGSLAIGYGIGTSRNMGPGYFPLLLSLAGAVLGLILIIKACFGTFEKREPVDVRRLLFVCAAFLVFALSIQRGGLFLTIVATTVVGSLAHRDSRILESLIFALVLAAATCLVFIQLLGLSIPVWPELA